MTTRQAKPSAVATIRARTSTVPPAPAGKVWTMEERLHRIEAMGQRISGYIEFICQVGSGGSSPEAKERAVTAFHERLTIVEKQLAAIHDDFRLE